MGRIPSMMSNSVEKYGLSYIRPYHKEIARRLVVGQTQATISRELGLTESRLSIIVNSPLFKLTVKKLEDERDKGVVDVTRSLKEIAPIALEQLERTMYGAKSETLRFKASESLLSRAGYGPINKGQLQVSGSVGVTHSDLSEEEIKSLIKRRLDRMSQESQQSEKMATEAEAIELEYEEVVEEEPSDDTTVQQMNDSNNNPIKLWLG